MPAAASEAPKVTRNEASARAPVAMSQNCGRLSELALKTRPESGSRMMIER